ncbi:hypothetical protein GCM10029978_036860 [Actinoallomurus acanthiterrae]
MAKSESIRPVTTVARVTRRDLRAAAAQGAEDGRRGLPVPPARLDELTKPPMTGYLGAVRAAADQASYELQAELRSKSTGKITEIYALGEVLVFTHDIQRRPSPGHRGRFLAAMTAWSTEVELCRRRAEAAVRHADQLAQWYWTHLVREHPALGARTEGGLARDWRPAPVELDPVWDKPDHLFFLNVDAESDPMAARMLRTIERAMAILTEHL